MQPTTTSNTTSETSTAQGPIEPVPSEELTKELMVSLSKEIETTMTSIMAFRTRVGFGMFVGPFLLLGSFIVGAQGQPVSFNLTRWGWIALVVDFACFMAIGFIAAKIEAQAFTQCNEWRKLILRLRNKPSAPIKESELEVKPKAYWGYLGGYALLFISVVAAVFIIMNAGTVKPPKSAGSGTTFRIEQVSPTEP